MANIKINSTPTRVQYTATGGQTVFSYTFPIKEDADLKVYKRAAGSTPADATDLLTLTTDYTVSGANTANGGTITLVVGATLSDIVTIVGDKTIDRNSIYDQSSSLRKEDLNNDFNDNVMYDKQIETIQDQVSIRYNDNESIGPGVRDGNLKLPILNENYFWTGQGNAGDSPDNVVATSVDDALLSSTVDFVIGTASIRFPAAQVLSALANGVMVNNAGTVIIRSTAGTVNEITVTDGDGIAGNPTFGLADNPVLPGTGSATAVSGTTGQRPGGVVEGMFRYNSTTLELEAYVQGSWKNMVTDNSSSTITVTQAAHGLSVGNVLRFDGVDYVLAQADSAANAEVAGIINEVINANAFTITQNGQITGLAGLTAGDLYFLDPVTPGALTAVEPVGPNIILPLMISTSATVGLFLTNLSSGTMAAQSPSSIAVTGGSATGLTTLATTLNGLDVNPGSDIDADLITVGVTGAPTFRWDESETAFNTNTPLTVGASATTSNSISSSAITSCFAVQSDAPGDDCGFSIERNTSVGFRGPQIVTYKSRGTKAARTLAQNGDYLARFRFTGFDGSDYATGAEIRVLVDGGSASNNMPGSMSFWTTPSGNQFSVERMTINNAGNILWPTGVVLDFGSGDYTITHSAGLLTTNGAFSIGTANALTAGTIELGAATDTTLARASAGDVNIEGNVVYRAGGTDVPVADGGTGRSSHTAYSVLCGGTTATGAQQSVASVGTAGQVLTSNGAAALPTFQAASGANTALSNLAAVAINTSLISDADITDDLGTEAIRWNNIYGATLRTGDTAADTLTLSARDVDGSSWTNFLTMTANNTPTCVLSGDVTSTTQAASDNSTKIATTAYADAAAAASGANTALSNLASVAINTSLISDTDVTDDIGTEALRWNNIYGATLRTGDTAADTLVIGARDVDGASWTSFVTLTANNTPTCVLSGDITSTTQAPADNSTKLATTAYADAAGAAGGADQALSNLAAVAINTSLISDTDITDDLGTEALRWNNVYSATLRAGDTAADTLTIGARDVDGASWTNFITLTSNNTPTCALSGDVTGVTQAASDNSTKLATTAYVDAVGSGANTALSNLAAVAINTSLTSDTDVTDDLGTEALRWNNIYGATLRTGDTAADTLVLGARDVDGAVWTDFITMTANNTPTCSLSGDVTGVTQAASDNSTKLATTAYADAASGAPSDATYITQTPSAGLSAEQALSVLATGIVKNTTTTGVLSIAAEGTDYYGPGGTDVVVADGGTGRSTATAYGVLCGGTTATGAHQSIASVGTAGQALLSNGAAALPTFTALPVEIIAACSDETTALTVSTDRVTFRLPHAMTLTGVRSSLTTAPTGSTFIVDIFENGTSVLGTKLSIDAGEKTSTTASSAATITDSNLADDSEITVDITQIGSTIAGAGLKVTLIGTRA